MEEQAKKSESFDLVVQKIGVSLDAPQRTRAEVVFDQFSQFLENAHEIELEARKIKVTDVSQVAEMEASRAMRLKLVKVRTSAEKVKDQLKAGLLIEAKIIDGFHNVVKGMVQALESDLLANEKFAENKEKERLDALRKERIEKLNAVEFDHTGMAVETWPEKFFAEALGNAEIALKAKRDAQAKAEQERIEREQKEAADREAQRLENERLKKEAEEREAQIVKERAEREKREKAEATKRERDRKAQEEKQRIEREEAAKKQRAIEEKAAKEKAELEAKAKAEREENEKKLAEERRRREEIEAENKRRRDEEEQKRKDEEAARLKAEAAPDKEKLIDFVKRARGMKRLELTSYQAQESFDFFNKKFQNAIDELEERANRL